MLVLGTINEGKRKPASLRKGGYGLGGAEAQDVLDKLNWKGEQHRVHETKKVDLKIYQRNQFRCTVSFDSRR
jgi:hypothetical protein